VSGVPPPEIAVPPPKVVVPPPVNDVPSPFGRRSLKLLPPGQILRLKYTKISAGAPPQTPLGEIKRLPTITGRGRTTSKGDGRKGREGKGGDGI